MRVAKPLLAAAMLLAPTVYPASAQEIVPQILTAEYCQPLTTANYELCCAALNREEILPRDLAGGTCPPLSSLRTPDEAVQQRAGTPPSIDETPTGSIPNNNPNRNVNAGRGNGGENPDGTSFAGGEDGDADPGNSGAHNNAGNAGPGGSPGGRGNK